MIEMTQAMRLREIAAAVLLLPLGALLTGCGVSTPKSAGTGSGSAVPLAVEISGSVHGGQQPVAGGQVYLYAASSNGYGTASTSLLNTAASGVLTDFNGNGYVATDANGQFSITGDYTCPSGALVYALALGGNPGLGVQANSGSIALMTALGPCASLASSTFISINELTTVAAVWALAPFVRDYADIGTGPSNVAGLTNAFAAAAELVNTASGGLGGAGLPAGTVLPVARMNTIADILSACVNTQGGLAGDGTACGNLFAATTPASGAAPTETIGAALAMATNPTVGLAPLFSLVAANAPFVPAASVAPTDWTLAVQYFPAGLSTPKAIAIDAASNVWIASCGSPNCTTSGAGSVTKLDSFGAVAGTTAPGAVNIPYTLAIDLNGNAWVANYGGNSISELSSTLAAVAPPFTGGGLSAPNSIAIDGFGNAWLTNAGTATESEFSSAGVPISGASGIAVSGLSAPVAIAINPH